MSERSGTPAGSRPPDVGSVLAAAPLPLVLTTPDARVLYANRAMQRLIGVPVADLVGRFLAEFAGPPHGRLRRLAAVAAVATHPITTEVNLSLGRRRSIAVRVVVARGASVGGDRFLVWQVTSSPTAHLLYEPGPEGVAVPADETSEPATPGSGGSVGPGCGHPVDPTGPAAVEGEPAAQADGPISSEALALALELMRTSLDLPVDEVAHRVATLAGKAFGGRPLRVAFDAPAMIPVTAATDPLANLAVQTEVELGLGPVHACGEGTVVAADLATDARFGVAGPELHRRLGITSALATPLRRAGTVVGSLVVYGETRDCFDAGDVSLAGWLATAAGSVLDAAVLYHSARTEVGQMRTAMASRAVIEQAKGILMARNQVDADAAFGLLKVASQSQNRRLRDVASTLVDTVTAPGQYDGQVDGTLPGP